MYYKLINGQNIVGVVSLNDFRRYQAKHGLVIYSDVDEAQYVEFRGVYYRDNWLRSLTTESVNFETVSIIRIGETEYNALLEAFETNDEIQVEPVEEQNQNNEPVIAETEQLTIEYVREAKIKQMSNICNQTIENGFDTVLSDHLDHHFSLTTNDQLNLITLSTMIASGETAIPYHADGELCVFYSVEDAETIIETATIWKTYHITYFNSLKSYIDSLETVEEIGAITYGVRIPEEFESDVLKSLYSV